MNADIKGRILAHIMFEELEKIAAKGSNLLKSLVTKNLDAPTGNIIKGVNQAKGLKPFSFKAHSMASSAPIKPKGTPGQFTPLEQRARGFRPEMDFADLKNASDDALLRNFENMDPTDFNYSKVQKELARRRNAAMRGPDRGPMQNIEEAAKARGDARRRATTPEDLLGEPLNTGNLDREMRREARLERILNSPKKPNAQELISRINDSKKQTKQVIKETATPSTTPKPSGGTKDPAARILEIDSEVSRLEKEIAGFQNRRYNPDIMGDIGPETQAAVDKKIKQLSNKANELKSQKKGLQSTSTPAANSASTPTPPTRASAKPKSGETNPALAGREAELNRRQQELNERAAQFINPPGGRIDEKVYAQYIKDADELQKARGLFEAEKRKATSAASAPSSTQFDIEAASTSKLRKEQKRLLDAGDTDGARNIQRKLDENDLTGYMDDATEPLTRDGTLVDATGTRNPPRKEPVSDRTFKPGDPSKGQTYEPGPPRSTRPRDVDTIKDDIQAQINAGVDDPNKLRTLQSELKAAQEGRLSYKAFPSTPASSAAPIPTKPSVNSYKNVDALIADQNYPLPEGVRTSIKDSGIVAGDAVKQMDPETVNFLRQKGVVVAPDLDARALSTYAKDTSNVKNLPSGLLVQSSDSGANATLQKMGLEFGRGGVLIHKQSGKVVGSTAGGKAVLFDQKRISTEAALKGASTGSVTKLEKDAVLKMDDLTAAASQGNSNLNHLKEVKQGRDTFLINANNGQVVGKKQGGNVVGVDSQEVAMLEQRFEDTQRRELLQSITPEGSNGLYSPEQIQKMGPEQKRLIPYTEGGTGIKTVDDFKMLEQRALDAERLFNEQAGAKKLFGNSDESKKAYAELEKTKLDLREQYREARESLIAQYQETATKQMNGTLPDTNAREVEEALKYLQEREVGFFNTTPLKNNTKGYKLPETPGGILGDSAKMGLGIGAAGLGAYALLGGSGSGGSQQDPYAQYGQY